LRWDYLSIFLFIVHISQQSGKSPKNTIDVIFRQAQKAFNNWSTLDAADRTTERLLPMLDFDFFEVLDSVTIARSRKHIQRYYDTTEIGAFPERNKPISKRCGLT